MYKYLNEKLVKSIVSSICVAEYDLVHFTFPVASSILTLKACVPLNVVLTFMKLCAGTGYMKKSSTTSKSVTSVIVPTIISFSL